MNGASEAGAGGDAGDSVAHARAHYDRALSDRFYHRVWAEDDLFIGVGTFRSVDDTLQSACRRTVENLAEALPPPTADGSFAILDLGSGYGAADRWLARRPGVRVVALNLSLTQNRYHRERNRAEGLDGRIEVIDGDFQHIPGHLGPFDAIWSQDAFVHASDRAALFAGMDRVLKPGGRVVFSDLLRDPACPDDALEGVRARLGLDGIESADGYRRLAQDRGWRVVVASERGADIAAHYRCLSATLDRRRPSLADAFTDDELDRIAAGITLWVGAATRGDLRWGLFHMEKPLG